MWSGYTAEKLNDDCLGSALDALYETGVTETYYAVASQALSQFEIDHRFFHLDTTTMSLHGTYNSELEGDYEKVIQITKGHSKDNAPDLNQVVVSLMTTYRSSFPIWFEALSGNSSDKTSFRETIKKFRTQFTGADPYYVCDSALYTKQNLSELSQTQWVTRVPETINEAKRLIQETNPAELPRMDRHHRGKLSISEYGGVRQRWLLIFSEKAYEREVVTLQKNLAKQTEKKEKALWHLCNQEFACQADAEKAVCAFIKKLHYHRVDYTLESHKHHGRRGRPQKNAEALEVRWKIKGTLIQDREAIESAKKTKGVFIIATNELDDQKLSQEQLLNVYKSQGVSVERGFRFLKDPLFYAESLYLKSPSRIMALIMVMCLSLLVYALAEKKIRDALQKNQLWINDQKNRKTNRPTIRWVFQVFEGILYLAIRDGSQITRTTMNLNTQHEIILTCLGPPYRKIYFLQN